MQGCQAEIWDDEAEAWVPCIIDQVLSFVVPNTQIKMRRYNVCYESKNRGSLSEKGVKSDRLRLRLAPEVTIADVEAVLAAEEPEATIDNGIDPNTGFGEWSTVEVREYNEEEEAERIRLAEQAAEEARAAASKKATAPNVLEENLPEMGDNALGAYNNNPNEAKLYRGVQLTETTKSSIRFEDEMHQKLLATASADEVGFKKSKRKEGSKSKKRRKIDPE